MHSHCCVIITTIFLHRSYHCKTVTLYPSNINSPFHLLLDPRKPPFYFLSYDFVYSKNLAYVE